MPNSSAMYPPENPDRIIEQATVCEALLIRLDESGVECVSQSSSSQNRQRKTKGIWFFIKGN